MSDKAILVGKRVVLCHDLHEWGMWMQNNKRHVANTHLGGVQVSTVFLGMDHSFDATKREWFETMIFGGAHDQECWRYATWEEAEAGHKRALEIAEFEKEKPK